MGTLFLPWLAAAGAGLAIGVHEVRSGHATDSSNMLLVFEVARGQVDRHDVAHYRLLLVVPHCCEFLCVYLLHFFAVLLSRKLALREANNSKLTTAQIAQVLRSVQAVLRRGQHEKDTMPCPSIRLHKVLCGCGGEGALLVKCMRHLVIPAGH